MTSERLITYEWLVEQRACYYEDDEPCELGVWLKPKLPITVPQLMRMRKIPNDDKLWALIRLMDENTERLFARRCALSVIHLWDAPDVVREWLETGDESIRPAAGDAAWYAAWYAARSAAWYAARYAARSAAWYAAGDAAGSAAGDAARYAKQRELLKLAAELLEDHDA